MRLTHLIMTSLAISFTTTLQAADFTFKYAHSQTDEAPRSESMRYFKEALEERSDGRIAVELYFNGTLGKEEDVLQQVQMGLIQGYRGGLFAQANPAYLIYTMPFLFTTPEQAIEVMEGELGQAINEGARESQLHIPVTGVAGGMRQLTNNVRAVNQVDDLRGLKIRTPPLAPTLRAFEALGASPQQVPYTETYMALRTGVVDGQENPPSNIADMKFHEAQEYMSLLNWQIHPDPFFISAQWYDQLPEELQMIVDDVAQETMTRSNEIWLTSEANYLETLNQQMSINDITDEHRQGFVDAVVPVWEHFVERGDFSQEQLEQVLALTGQEEVME
ncbi:TRAP transporter substrate-binding protein [Halomonas sp. SpR1]|uniref:TRAP transporter substrate-binding protein n=1 Tax=Halomonas sp. SpR1 TaxID=3050462 RepID=UPI0027E4632F|nr:TRAP transporter substrate-binding protein [Halomonas sp. SpR1]MDQ7734102.1 TRAP transporter substrate-binding protein [Halomonas sp. SpR1]